MNLIQIIIKNTYAHKNTVINFKEGINYITGKNESGKTVVLNMISYALFGSAALRGPVTDYKKLEVTLVFSINNKIYSILRSTKDILTEVITTKVDGKDVITTKEIAIGKSPVNTHIIELLGYGLDVFYKMNFSQQLDGDSYATSKKSERLDLINKINGVDEANLLEKHLESKKKAFKSEIKGLDMSSVINNIIFTPNPVLDHLTEKDLEEFSQESVKLYSRITELESILTAHMMIPEIDSGMLQLIQNLSQKAYNSLYESDKVISVDLYLSELTQHIEQIGEIEKQVKRLQSDLELHPIYSKDTGEYITKEEVDKLQADLENNHLYKHKQSLLSQGDITCPSCDTTFPLMYKSTESYGDIQLVEMNYTASEVSKASYFVENYLQKCLDSKVKLVELQSQLDKLREIQITCSLSQAKIDKQQLDSYKSKVANYEAAVNKFKTKYPSVQDVSGISNEVTSTKAKLDYVSKKRHELELYLREKSVYTSAQESKKQIDLVVKERQDKIKAYDEFIEESKAIKLAIQNRSIPTLNKKASEIVNKMTGGEHYSLTLSDTFELLLDGKLLSAYSGSTQVTANVAFRISLIELFYKKTFPVFIGDEIDSFADKDRAEHIHTALNRLAKEGYQILLISHHSIKFEGNVIDLNAIKAKK